MVFSYAGWYLGVLPGFEFFGNFLVSGAGSIVGVGNWRSGSTEPGDYFTGSMRKLTSRCDQRILHDLCGAGTGIGIGHGGKVGPPGVPAQGGIDRAHDRV
jgi:hypothetical protein